MLDLTQLVEYQPSFRRQEKSLAMYENKNVFSDYKFETEAAMKRCSTSVATQGTMPFVHCLVTKKNSNNLLIFKA